MESPQSPRESISDSDVEQILSANSMEEGNEALLMYLLSDSSEEQSAQENADDPSSNSDLDDPPRNPGWDLEDVHDNDTEPVAIPPTVEASGGWDSSTLEAPRRRPGAEASVASTTENNSGSDGAIPDRTRESTGSDEVSSTRPANEGKGKAREIDTGGSSSRGHRVEQESSSTAANKGKGKARQINTGGSSSYGRDRDRDDTFFSSHNIDERLLNEGLHRLRWKDYSAHTSLDPADIPELSPSFNPQFQTVELLIPPFSNHHNHHHGGREEQQDPEERDVVETTEIHLGDEEDLDSILLDMVEEEEREGEGRRKRKGRKGRGGEDKKRQRKR